MGVAISEGDLVLLHHVQPKVYVHLKDGLGEDLLRREICEEAVGVVDGL